LAYGVDSCAHNLALKRGIGTVAVVAGGIDKGFPSGNSKLYEDLCNRGAVISEFPPGKNIVKGMFPMRNRLMAAMSSSTLVVEAGERSGSLITSQVALDLGRDVFSVPGDINRTYSRGCNRLIAGGAIPLVDYAEYWSENSVNLGDIKAVNLATKFGGINDASIIERLIKLIKENGEISLSSASEASSVDASKLIVLLTNLEIEGILSRNELGNYTYNY
jgi:DNA processing protein